MRYIQDAVSRLAVDGYPDIRLSVSIGGVHRVEPLTEAIRQADQLMYRDKANKGVLRCNGKKGSNMTLPGIYAQIGGSYADTVLAACAANRSCFVSSKVSAIPHVRQALPKPSTVPIGKALSAQHMLKGVAQNLGLIAVRPSACR